MSQSNQFDPETVARGAIARVTSLGYVHDDLEWRHVALMPSFVDGELEELRPVLIDLSSIRAVNEGEDAADYMENKLQELIRKSEPLLSRKC